MPATIPIAQERIILGIDPGTTIMGYGVLRVTGNNPELLTMGVLQLGKMGEDPEDYATIWTYTEGKTEPRFSLYEYPEFDFRITDKMSNLEIG